MNDLVEQFLTLHASANAKYLNPRRDAPASQTMILRTSHFDESVFKIDEVNALETRVAAQFDNETVRHTVP